MAEDRPDLVVEVVVVNFQVTDVWFLRLPQGNKQTPSVKILQYRCSREDSKLRPLSCWICCTTSDQIMKRNELTLMCWNKINTETQRLNKGRNRRTNEGKKMGTKGGTKKVRNKGGKQRNKRREEVKKRMKERRKE